MTVTVGSEAIDRASNIDLDRFQNGYSVVDMTPVTSDGGVIQSVEIFLDSAGDSGGVSVATFTAVGNVLTRAFGYYIGLGSVTKGSKQTISGFIMRCPSPGYIGCGCFAVAAHIEADTSGGNGVWYNNDFGTVLPDATYSVWAGYAISLKGTGIEVGTGSRVINRNNAWTQGETVLEAINPLLYVSNLTTFKIWATGGNLGTCKAGTFFGSGADWERRDYEAIATVVAGSLQTFAGLNCSGEIGDILGFWFATGGSLEFSSATRGDEYGNFYYKTGDQFDAGEQAYSGYANWMASLWFEGEEVVVRVPRYGFVLFQDPAIV